ncbi:Alkaline phosphatase [hydrothermal vent metagenome]|uniref:Alkaline phosphatase n=1 Tax=hydrothermal vent metagenome TaxID=652676 RepID=A0A1W1CFI7_9ZZZZ
MTGGDSSETMYVVITGVDTGFSISGAVFIGGSGETREWLVESTDFNNVQLDIPANYSGEINFKLQLHTPETEGSINISDSQDEDNAKVLDFGFSNGGDATEQLETLWINTESIDAGIELVTAGGVTLTQTTVGSDQWVQITVTNSVAESVTSNILASKYDNDGDYTFDIRYSTSDSSDDSTTFTDRTQIGNTYDSTTTTDYVTATYSVSLNAVTDTTTLNLGTITDVDGDGSNDLTYDAGTQTVTILDNTIFNVPLTLIADDMADEGPNGQDLDGSETISTLVEISGVPKGIDIVGGTYLGDIDDGSGGAIGTGLWRVNITEDLIINSASGELNNIKFEVGNASYADINAMITLEVSHTDGSVQTLINTQSFNLVIDSANFAGTQVTTDESMDILVSNVPVTFIEDSAQTLDNFLLVSDDALSANNSSKFAITITNLSGGTVSGMTDEGSFYSLTGIGDVSALLASLNSISITPNTNQNINSNNPQQEVTFDVTITTYGSASHNAYPFDNLTSEIQAVTDETTTTISGSGTLVEDTTITYTIGLGNSADETRNILVDGTVYFQLGDTVSTDGGNSGVFVGIGFTLPALTTIVANQVQDGQGASIPAGDYYVVTGLTYTDSIQVTYTPPANEYGNNITITSYALTQEDALSSGYTTQTWITTDTLSATVAPVTDGISVIPTISGDEDGVALVSFLGSTFSDTSEGIDGATLTGVLFKYDVYYQGTVQTGTVTGKDANGDYIYKYTFAATSIADLETIGIKRIGVEDFSGEVVGLNLSVNIGESGLEASQSWNITAAFNPVADSLLNMTVTKTFGDEYTWVDINMNANVKDTDGSETLQVSFSGAVTALDDTALFRLSNGTTIPSGTMTASFNAGVWTVAGIAYDDINDLQLLYKAYNGDIDVVVKTVDAATNLPADTLSDVNDSQGTFNLRLDASTTITTGDEDNVITTSDAGVTVNSGAGADTITGGAGNDTISGEVGADTVNAGEGADTIITDGADTIDGGLGEDTIVLTTGATLDFSLLDNIEIINLTANGDHTLANLSLDDILGMTDSDNLLTITGDVADDVSTIDTTGWTQDTGNVGNESNGDNTSTYEYSRGADSVILTIDDQIDSTGM